jgi:cytochrome c biogenesis protein CcmG/thiol:disulfide interchange protein DsbE
MKQLFIVSLIFLSFQVNLLAQNDGGNPLENKKVPAVNLKDLKGKTYNTANLGLKGPVVISFWATWCAPCKKELNAIHELYEEWQAETGVTLVAVSIDDEKTKSQVPVYVNGKAWEFLVLSDPNGDFKRAMGVNNVPHTFLIDKDGNIVYSHNNYAPGDEEKLYKEIKKLSGK